MTAHATSPAQLLPRPRKVRQRAGVFKLSGMHLYVVTRPGDSWALSTARLLCRLASPVLKLSMSTTHSAGQADGRSAFRPPPSENLHQGIILLERTPLGRGDQWYALQIRSGGIRLRASSVSGFRYGAMTLSQLLISGESIIQAMDIEDWPDIPVRGVLLDISRGKVPTMETLKRLITRLAGWKINQLQLYMEHTFAYQGHESVWRGASPMTGSQIRDLDRFCKKHGIELVPNQNSFSHLENWLRHPRYSHLAECTGPWKTPWGELRRQSTTLNPLDAGSIRLISSLYTQLVPHFSSRLLNVGCDEPWELGQGKSRSTCRRRGADQVYLDYLLKLRRQASRVDHRIMFWGDWTDQHPHLISRLPGDVIPLVWGYEPGHSFDRSCLRLKNHGLDFYICPGTSSWCSFGGRTTHCLTNLREAAQSGKRHRAAGYLINDWGDFGHRQYLPVSYTGFLYGAAASWCLRSNRDLDVAAELSRHVFHDASGEVGRLWLEAGRVHEMSGVELNNRTILFSCMQTSLGDYSGVEGLAPGRAEHMAKRIGELKTLCRRAHFNGADGNLIKDELLATLAVLHHACRRAQFMVNRRSGLRSGIRPRQLAEDMRGIIDRHRALWLQRNRRGGLAVSVGYYRKNLKEYLRLST